MTTVGVIGLGRMGARMADAFSKHHDTLGWDVREVRVEGTGQATSAADLAERCDVIVSSLPAAQHTAQVVLDAPFARAFADSGAVFVDTSTSSPASIRDLAARLGKAGERIVDAPILGRPDACGSWTVPMGGTPEAVQRVAPTLEAIAKRTVHVGALGSGHTIKLLNNMMFAAINVATAEALSSSERLGLDPATFVDVVAGSAAATVSPLFQALAPRMLGEDLPTVFTVSLLHKDLTLALEMCTEAGADLVAAPHLATVTEAALALGLGDEDSAALIDVYRDGLDHRTTRR